MSSQLTPRRALCALALLCVAAVPWRGEGPVAPRSLLAIEGPLAPAAAHALARSVDLYGDWGAFALGEGTAASVAKLELLGLTVVDLGAWPTGRDLVVTRAGGEAHHAPPADAELLYAARGGALLAVPPGSMQPTCHELSLVRRRAWRPTRPLALPLVATDARVADLVADVVPANVQAKTTHLATYFTRRADSAQILQAQTWLMGQLAALPAWDVSTIVFDGSYAPNVVAEKTGSVHPERVLVLGAHLDSINLSGSSLPAPGADDNASGSAGLLEAARVLAEGEFENTIRLVWYSAEELGLIGSDADAELLGDSAFAMLNMDMIAHRAAGDPFDLDFATNSTDPALTQFCRDVTAAYVPGLPTVTGLLTAGSSDHASYQAHGIPAAFYFEDLDEYSMVIHTSSDTMGTSANDFVLAGEIVKAFVAAAATLAEPVDLALAHVALADTSDAGGPYEIAADIATLTPSPVESAEIVWRFDGGAWQSRPLLASAGDDWVGSIPGVLAAGQLAGRIDYYLFASDADGHLEWWPEAYEPGSAFASFLVETATTIWSEGFEGVTDAGWTHQQIATQDDWQRGAPGGKSGDPSSAATGVKVWGNDLGPDNWNGAYQPDVINELRSPLVDCSAASNLHLRYERWLTVEDATYDEASIRVDAAEVWQNPATPGGSQHHIDTDWVLHDLDVSSLADGDASVQILFRLESDGGLEFGGWNVDDVRLLSPGPGTVPPLVASEAWLSSSGGGSVALDLDAGPAFAGRTAIVLMSFSGTTPGTNLGSVHLPLTFDALTSIGLSLLGNPALPGFAGPLDASGEGAALLTVPGGIAPLAGLTIHFAFLTLGPIDFASNAVGVGFVP